MEKTETVVISRPKNENVYIGNTMNCKRQKNEYLIMFNRSIKQLKNSEVVIISMEEFINE